MTKKRFKRSWIFWMLMASPLVSAEPISLMQGIPMPLNHVSVSPVPPPVQAAKKASQPIRKRKSPVYEGVASWYSETDPGINLHTANGEVFDDQRLTCASWDFPFGTLLEVKNKANGRTVVCRVNDRGPAKRLHRLVDLTQRAFSEISALQKGLIRVEVRRIKPASPS